MKKTTKIIALLLAFMMLASVFCPCASADDSSRGGDEIVAVLYHCVSGTHMPYLFGHSWICIENISAETLYVGSQEIAPGKMISAGLHAAKGMVFNREMGEYRGSSVTAIKADMTRNDLKKAEKEILNSKWGWYEFFGHNCTNFSASVWKAVTGEKYNAFIFPAVIKNQFPSNRKISLYIA